MPRRVSLPGAAELFRPTRDAEEIAADQAPVLAAAPEPAPEPPGRVRGSGRVRHEEKFTVYVSSEELLALERARLLLRADHGLAVDRGRIVREALALALEDLDAHGADAELVRRLTS